MTINLTDFGKIDIRTGTIVKAELFPEANKSAFKLTIDFGPLGILKSSAQITDLYDTGQLEGIQVVAVINFPPKQIANFISECLVLGAVRIDGSVVLLQTERKTENGLKIS
jgi:tRNA-binding protein